MNTIIYIAIIRNSSKLELRLVCCTLFFILISPRILYFNLIFSNNYYPDTITSYRLFLFTPVSRNLSSSATTQSAVSRKHHSRLLCFCHLSICTNSTITHITTFKTSMPRHTFLIVGSSLNPIALQVSGKTT